MGKQLTAKRDLVHPRVLQSHFRGNGHCVIVNPRRTMPPLYPVYFFTLDRFLMFKNSKKLCFRGGKSISNNCNAKGSLRIAHDAKAGPRSLS